MPTRPISPPPPSASSTRSTATTAASGSTTHKDDYERHVREPFLQLITDLQAPLAKISPHYRADPRKNGGSLFRIHRDTRFSNNKLPYKPWQGARFFHERRHEIPAPSFYMHIQPGDCFAGGGMWHPGIGRRSSASATFIADNPAAWKKATQQQGVPRALHLLGRVADPAAARLRSRTTS